MRSWFSLQGVRCWSAFSWARTLVELMRSIQIAEPLMGHECKWSINYAALNNMNKLIPKLFKKTQGSLAKSARIVEVQ